MKGETMTNNPEDPNNPDDKNQPDEENQEEEHALGDEPIDANVRDDMQGLAMALDAVFNGEKQGRDRTVGFVLMVFPYNGHEGRCNYISNGADRKDIAALMTEQIVRFREREVEEPGG
jgi:hypothetical protein